MSARPGRTRSPSAASFTSMRQRPFRRVAKAAVNPSGMCWTTTIPGPSAGIFWSSSVSASVPPVDAPTATMRSAGTPAPGPGRGGRTASAVRRGEAVSRRLPTRASAAPRTASRKTTADSCRNSRMLMLRLRHDRERPFVEGAHREVGSVAGQRGAHHHGDGVLRHDPRQEREAVHARQLEVEDDDVGPLPRHLLHGDVRIRRDGRHDALEREEGGQRLAHDGRVVDDEHLERAFGRHAVRASGRPGTPAPFGLAWV